MLRILVACPDCRRQHDATGFAPRSRFHCSCGTTLEVPTTSPHDAGVVRCSSCGGARERDASACTYCGADFTLHEQEMHTICSSCATRVSDRARFCHHCATPIAPQGRVGEPTEHACPGCGPRQRLTSRRLGELSVLECGGCAGLWLGNEAFEHLLDEARERAAASTGAGATPRPTPRRQQAAGQGGSLYRRCPRCEHLMYRRNFGSRSGVIVDTCKQHGIWFDASELDRVLQWVRGGGEARARKRDEERRRHAERAARFKPDWKQRSQGGPAWGGGPTAGRGLEESSFVGQILELLLR